MKPIAKLRWVTHRKRAVMMTWRVRLALLLMVATIANAQHTAPRKILILQSYGRDIAPWNAITPAFKNELVRQLESPVEFYETGPESARGEDSKPERVFMEYLRTLYAEQPPDLVIPVGAAATQMWWRHRQSLFPSVPVVIGGMEHRLLQTLPFGSNDTAVTVQIDIARTAFDPIFELFPATTNVAMVIGDSRIERFWNIECQRAWTPFSHRAQLVSFSTLPFPEICDRVASLPPRSVLGYWIFWVDAAGVPHEQTRALDQVCSVANAPVFGLFEEQLGHGIVGGRLVSSESIGREAARLAARVLGGESAGKIPPVVLRPGPPTFDWRQLQRWNVDQRLLPPGSIVRFRQATPWQRYRWYIMSALGIITLQALTIARLLVQRGRRQRAEVALRENLSARHEAELAVQRHRNKLRHISRVHVLSQLSSALAHELNQPLGAMLSNAEAAELLLQKNALPLDEVRDILADIRKDNQHASDVIQRMRGFLRRHEMELKPLSTEELIADCIALARPDAVERKVSVETQVVPGTPAVRADRVHLEQVLLNLLVNGLDAMRECPVEQRRLLIRAEPGAEDTVLFSVIDSGPGIPPDQLERIFDSFHTTKPNGLGVGLAISRTIIEAHHGRLWAENIPNGGAAFRFTLAVAEEAPTNSEQ